MKSRILAVLVLALALLCPGAGASAQRQRRESPAVRPQPTTRQQPARQQPPRRQRAGAAQRGATPNAADARMTGLYRLNREASGDPLDIAERATAHLSFEERQRALDDLMPRLSSPGQIAIRRRGRTIDLASTRAPLVTFEADGVTHAERADDGRTLRSRAALYGDNLMVSSTGSTSEEFSVNIDSIEGGRRLRVTRRISDPRLGGPVVVQSIYDRVSQVARFDVYGQPDPAPVATARNSRAARGSTPQRDTPQQQSSARVPPRTQPQQPPVIRRSEPARRPRPAEDAPEPFGGFYIEDDARFYAVLDHDLSTETAREGDPFTMTVREPAGFAGAKIEGRVARVERGGRVSGRAELELEVERVRLPDGRTQEFVGFIEDVRPPEGVEDVRVDNESEGRIGERDSPTSRTAQRAAIGAAVGAIIGAIADGGKGAAIGGAIGAGVGAGSVYAQGRDHLELRRGTEIVLSLRARQQ